MWRSALGEGIQSIPPTVPWSGGKTIAAERMEDFTPSVTELEYMKRHAGMSKYNLAFRRRGLNTEFVGDTRLFSCKYPSDPYDGWLGTTNPVMPAEVLKPWLAKAKADPPMSMHGCHEFDAPIPGRKYLITADPAGFGSTGDKSALTVWDAQDWREVALGGSRNSRPIRAKAGTNTKTIQPGIVGRRVKRNCMYRYPQGPGHSEPFVDGQKPPRLVRNSKTSAGI